MAVVLTGPAEGGCAAAGAELLIAGHRPRWIISAGFAGGLDPALARNDLVLPHEVIDLGAQPDRDRRRSSRDSRRAAGREGVCSRSIG